MRMLPPLFPRIDTASDTATLQPQSQIMTFLSYIDSADGPNIGWTEHTFLLDAISFSTGIIGVFRDVRSNIRASGPHIPSKRSRMSPVTDIGTETMTTSEDDASDSVRPLSEAGSIISTVSPNADSILENHPPIFPEPPTTDTFLCLPSAWNIDAWAATDSSMTALHTLSATSGSIPFAEAKSRYLPTTRSSTEISLISFPEPILYSPILFATSRRFLIASRISMSAFLISSLSSSSPMIITLTSDPRPPTRSRPRRRPRHAGLCTDRASRRPRSSYPPSSLCRQSSARTLWTALA